MNISDKMNGLTKRVSALESTDYDEAAGVARITKIYGNIRITTTVRAYLHSYRKCGDTNPIYPAVCAADSFI